MSIFFLCFCFTNVKICFCDVLLHKNSTLLSELFWAVAEDVEHAKICF